MKTNNLINTDRIPLSEQRQSLLFVFCGISALLTLAVPASLFYYLKSLVITGIVFILLGSIFGLIYFKLRSRIASGYIHNNMVILKMLNDKNYVLDFRCIKSVSTKNVLGFKISVIKFKFDGNKYLCYLIGNEGELHGGDIIREARKKYFLEKKASHKPGSVHSAS